MATVRNGEIEIYYETAGDPAGTPLLLIAGLGCQMIWWDPTLLEVASSLGYYCMVFDHRDTGLSSKLPDDELPDFDAMLLGDNSSASYTLYDMAEDAACVMRACSVDKAHVIGVSMGGMVAQALAISHPEMIATLCLVSTTTGDPLVGQISDEAAMTFLTPDGLTREQRIDHAVAGSKVTSSPGFEFDEDYVRRRLEEFEDRCYYPIGNQRHMAAMFATGDRTERLRELDIATLVIHGDRDLVVNPSGGIALAEAIAGARLVVIPGMGHDLPADALGQIIEAVLSLHASAVR